MSYAQPSDLLLRYDARTVGDLVNDTGVRQLPAQLQADPVVQMSLDDATGMINSAILYGERYTEAELSALTGVDQAILIRLNCDIAFGYLAQRRGNDPAKFPSYVQAMEMLEALKEGRRIFNVLGDVADGTASISYPSVSARVTINQLRDQTADRFFPVRPYQQTSSD